MTLWLDAHLPPSVAPWVAAGFGVGCVAARDLGLRDALDPPIFAAARVAGAVVMTKDADFAEMVRRLGAPPQVLWLRCGNTSNAALRELLSRELPAALARLAAGEPLVELGVDAA
ncbi:MAG: DUF5615 family PIN-like protein [Gemmataceae bacterium]|nr:DUF5615 family PIN-like protein [Gemmataceae bacterium]